MFSDAAPRFPGFYFSEHSSGDSKLSRILREIFPGCQNLIIFNSIRFRDFSISRGLSVLFDHIRHIVSVCAEPKMMVIHTSGVVTRVHNNLRAIFGYGSMFNYISDSMGLFHLALDAIKDRYAPISLFILSSGPLPAARTILKQINFIPKSEDDCFVVFNVHARSIQREGVYVNG